MPARFTAALNLAPILETLTVRTFRPHLLLWIEISMAIIRARYLILVICIYSGWLQEFKHIQSDDPEMPEQQDSNGDFHAIVPKYYAALR